MNTIQIDVKDSKCAHFWHFCMGEFLPIISMIVAKRATKVILYNKSRIWGKTLDRFYKDIEGDDLKIIFSNKKMNNKLFYYHSWDFDWNDRDIEKCFLAINWLKKRTIQYFRSKKIFLKDNKSEVLVQLRKNNKEFSDYYKSDTFQDTSHLNMVRGSKKYGFDKRGYYDMEILKYYFKNKDVSFCYGDGKNIYEQIFPYINKENIILSHGAGMVFVLFMKNGSKVIEIITPQKYNGRDGSVQGLKRICIAKKNSLKQIVLKNKTSIKNINRKLFSLKSGFKKYNKIILKYSSRGLKMRKENQYRKFYMNKNKNLFGRNNKIAEYFIDKEIEKEKSRVNIMGIVYILIILFFIYIFVYNRS